MSDKPVDFAKHRALAKKMQALESQMRALRKEFATPEAVSAAAVRDLAWIYRIEAQRTVFNANLPWLLEAMTLQAVILKMSGSAFDVGDCLAMVSSDTKFLTKCFTAEVDARILKMQEELIQ